VKSPRRSSTVPAITWLSTSCRTGISLPTRRSPHPGQDCSSCQAATPATSTTRAGPPTGSWITPA
jgi:hypothetical protein